MTLTQQHTRTPHGSWRSTRRIIAGEHIVLRVCTVTITHFSHIAVYCQSVYCIRLQTAIATYRINNSICMYGIQKEPVERNVTSQSTCAFVLHSHADRYRAHHHNTTTTNGDGGVGGAGVVGAACVRSLSMSAPFLCVCARARARRRLHLYAYVLPV